MDFPLFSQIPRVVLEKLDTKKKVKFTKEELDTVNNEDEDVRQVTSSWQDKEVDPVYSSKSRLSSLSSPPEQHKLKSALKKTDHQIEKAHHIECPPTNEDKPLKNKTEVLDAIVQTNPKTPTRDMSTQTYDTYPPMLENYNLFKTQLEANALSKFNAIYSFPKGDGKPPPLKIGLTLRGKKRKVFYPDEKEEQEVAPGS